ncbi:hypothetical protein [Teichococcus aestuarii]|uniref:Uncharacterized protein n=1 Tax=Teichococcus aestuarii TaxID=568898 RepID=A0A2U1V0H4_9PROT|nr:hypothetical protein [Pseudoroseomonas aestuarii]PWC27407.1 hypothetical protein CR165_18365 [Pseudoroseomonas aestuarii]
MTKEPSKLHILLQRGVLILEDVAAYEGQGLPPSIPLDYVHSWLIEVRGYLFEHDLEALCSEMEVEVSGNPIGGLPSRRSEVIHALVKTTHLLKILKLRE